MRDCLISTTHIVSYGITQARETLYDSRDRQIVMKSPKHSHCVIALLSVALIAGVSCRRQDSAHKKAPELILYCGAGIRPAAEKLIRAFEAEHDVRIAATYAGSGRLLGQLAASRTGDLFMPGSAFYVDKAIDDSMAEADTRRTAAYFIPTIFVGKGNPLGVEGLSDFATMDMRVGLGDERAVAIGKQSVRLFDKNGIPLEAVRERTVFKSGTVNELGVAIEMENVDAVIVWDANARQFAHAGDAIPIPTDQNIITTIPIVQLTFSQYSEDARAFIGFVVSEPGRRILEAEGYTVRMEK